MWNAGLSAGNQSPLFSPASVFFRSTCHPRHCEYLISQVCLLSCTVRRDEVEILEGIRQISCIMGQISLFLTLPLPIRFPFSLHRSCLISTRSLYSRLFNGANLPTPTSASPLHASNRKHNDSSDAYAERRCTCHSVRHTQRTPVSHRISSQTQPTADVTRL
ncbi:hypothetical protein BJ165DRAFT_267352 [Panaeolus papilionaceus]|nr:hypothetical protein BJ165DRAFT_267352 [Panaeolus papilionaceus]